MNYPKYVEVDGKKYKINTDFRYALQCEKIAKDENIKDIERAMAIIYTLFGEEALEDYKNMDKLLDIALKYMTCGQEQEENKEEPDMDFEQDMDYIEASFMSDYKIDLENTEMHWWKFMKLINGLSNSELGNCCVLNNIRNLRNYDVSQIKDDKERSKIIKAKERVALKKQDKIFTTEEQDNMDEFNKLAGL